MKDRTEYIYIQKEDHIWEKVLLEDIYYIETLKSTHYCQIKYKEGVGKIRADITPLYQEFSPWLFRTKASTLANLNQVQKVDIRNRLLYFDQDIYCSYAQRVAGEIKTRLRIKNYRNYGGGEHEQSAETSI